MPHLVSAAFQLRELRQLPNLNLFSPLQSEEASGTPSVGGCGGNGITKCTRQGRIHSGHCERVRFPTPPPGSLHRKLDLSGPFSGCPLHPFVHRIIHSFVSQVEPLAVGSPCRHAIGSSGISARAGAGGQAALWMGVAGTGSSEGGRLLKQLCSSGQGCLAQHFFQSFLVAGFQGQLSAPGHHKGSFEEKSEAK